MDFDYLEWIEFMVRWFHVIAGIAWIGSSFYFIALDLSLRKSSSLPKEAHGEAWQVHGGGFYNLVKYLVAPNHLPDHLTWFKWEAYATWITGAALFILVYYLGAELYLIDYEKIELSKTAAVLISITQKVRLSGKMTKIRLSVPVCKLSTIGCICVTITYN